MDVTLKRKNIDLPTDVLHKLSIMAASQSKSLKAFIESILVHTANSVSIEISNNPSPSGDPWWNELSNVAAVNRGIEDLKNNRGKEYTKEDIENLLND
jgi:hypothetical protein